MSNQPVGRFPDEHLVCRRSLLEPRRRIDRVPGDEPLSGSWIAGDDFTCVDARPVADRHAPSLFDLFVQLSEAGAHFEGGADRPDRIVLVHTRQTEDGHDRIADVLLDDAPVTLEGGTHLVEVPGHHLAHGLRIELLAHGGRAFEVGEDDRHGLADLLRWQLGCEWRAAEAAKAELVWVFLAATWANLHKKECRVRLRLIRPRVRRLSGFSASGRCLRAGPHRRDS